MCLTHRRELYFLPPGSKRWPKLSSLWWFNTCPILASKYQGKNKPIHLQFLNAAHQLIIVLQPKSVKIHDFTLVLKQNFRVKCCEQCKEAISYSWGDQCSPVNQNSLAKNFSVGEMLIPSRNSITINPTLFFSEHGSRNFMAEASIDKIQNQKLWV